jgi:hypothetical protein
VVATAAVLMLPVTASAKPNDMKPAKHGGHGSIVNIFINLYNSTIGNFIISVDHGTVNITANDVPEFSTDAAAGAVALLVGGSVILMSRRRKELV